MTYMINMVNCCFFLFLYIFPGHFFNSLPTYLLPPTPSNAKGVRKEMPTITKKFDWYKSTKHIQS